MWFNKSNSGFKLKFRVFLFSGLLRRRKVAADSDSVALGFKNWQLEASDRASFRRHLREVMGHN
jgi:hypothetical protein